jgi:hypothetical protein
MREITSLPTNGLFVVVSQIPVNFNFEIHTYHFPVPDEATIRRIVPGVSDEVVTKCKGDLRYAIQSLTLRSDDKDEFQGAKDFIESLVSRTTPKFDFIYFFPLYFFFIFFPHVILI